MIFVCMQPFIRFQARLITKSKEEIDLFKRFFLEIFDEKEQKIIEQKQDSFIDSQEETTFIQTLLFEKKRHLAKIIPHVFSFMSKMQLQEILEQLDSRIDEDCFFFLRFTKQILLQKTVELTQSGDCVHCQFLVGSYPAKKESAVSAVESFLNHQMNSTI